MNKLIAIVVEETAKRRIEAINVRFIPHQEAFNRRASDINENMGKRSRRETYARFYGLLDDIARLHGDDTACRKGCSHCCHIAVAIPHIEADEIAERIGVPRQTVPHTYKFKDFPYGYSRPCTFLNEKGLCSIYEHRPMACRTHYSLAPDASMCELTEEARNEGVPYLNMGPMQILSMQIAAFYQRGVPSLGEIRELFPTGLAVPESTL